MRKLLLFTYKYLKSFFKIIGTWCIRYPIATALTILLVITSIFVLISGVASQIGGILGSILSKKKEDTRNIPPEERRKSDGALILPGESDEQGFVQASITTQIADPSILSNPSNIVITHPDKEKIVIDLPTGVENKDVQEVIEVKPDVHEIRNKDTGIKSTDLNDLIKKLGG